MQPFFGVGVDLNLSLGLFDLFIILCKARRKAPDGAEGAARRCQGNRPSLGSNSRRKGTVYTLFHCAGFAVLQTACIGSPISTSLAFIGAAHTLWPRLFRWIPCRPGKGLA